MKRDPEDSTRDSKFWRFVEETAKAADRMPAWMKGGPSKRAKTSNKKTSKAKSSKS